MRVFRGDSESAILATLSEGPRIAYHGHAKKKCFCTTLSIDIAQLFAMRRSPIGVLQGDLQNSGLVLEYHLNGKEGKDWQRIVDHRALQDEQEVIVFKAEKLTPAAIWRMESVNEWHREEIT